VLRVFLAGLFLNSEDREGSRLGLLPAKKEERWRVYDRAKGACICPSCPSSTMVRTGELCKVHFCIVSMSFRWFQEDKGCTLPAVSGVPGDRAFQDGMLHEGEREGIAVGEMGWEV